jgi:hypothetical protein
MQKGNLENEMTEYVPQWKRAKLVAYNDNGGHFYKKTDGSIILISKDLMKEQEDLHIRPEHGWPGYDPVWAYNWIKIGEDIDRRSWFESLTDEQREVLKNTLKTGNKK